MEITAMKIFLIVEDKKEEQEAALLAIQEVLEISGEPDIGYRAHSTNSQMAFKNAKVLVMFANCLGFWQTNRLELVMRLNKDLRSDVYVVTDLMFPASEGGKEAPWGLEVVTSCVKASLPVVVCSDTDHHDVGWLKTVFPVIGNAHPRGEIPVILDKKDWVKAVKEVLRISGTVVQQT